MKYNFDSKPGDKVAEYLPNSDPLSHIVKKISGTGFIIAECGIVIEPQDAHIPNGEPLCDGCSV